MPSFHIIHDLLRDFWSSGDTLKIAGKSYTVHRMNYGDYFLQPHGWEGGEKDGFAPGTLWLTHAPKGHPHGAGYVLDDERNGILA